MATNPLSNLPFEPSDLEKAFQPLSKEQLEAAAKRRVMMEETKQRAKAESEIDLLDCLK